MDKPQEINFDPINPNIVYYGRRVEFAGFAQWLSDKGLDVNPSNTDELREQWITETKEKAYKYFLGE